MKMKAVTRGLINYCDDLHNNKIFFVQFVYVNNILNK